MTCSIASVGRISLRWSSPLWALLVFGGTALSGEKPALVIRGGSVFDSVSGKMQPDRTIVIEEGRIKAIGSPDRPVTLPKGAQTIDARGKFLIPGLIDAHAHLVEHVSAPDGWTATKHPHLNGAEILPLFLGNGITSLRETGDPIVPQAAVAHYARAHPEQSPRVFLCSPLLDADPPYHRVGSQDDRGRPSSWSGRDGPSWQVRGPGGRGGRHRLPGAHLVRVQLHRSARSPEAAFPAIRP